MTFSVESNCSFFERIFKLLRYSRQHPLGSSDDKNWLDFFSIFFKIRGVRSSILLSLCFHSMRSDLTVAWFSWTSQNSFAMHSNQWNYFICIDNRLRQMAFLCAEWAKSVAWFSWTNQNSFATHSNQWNCFNCIDNRLRQMAFFRVCQSGQSARQRPAFESCGKILK